MSRELVTAEQIKPPKELQVFFDDPPLVGNERREDYENFFRTIAAAVKPADAILWVLVRDFADITWEIRRERKIKADIIKLKQKEVLVESSFRMTRDDYLREHALGPVENQDSTRGLVVIQASDGTIRTDGRPMGEDGAALSG